MKRGALLRHLRHHGCVLKREGSRHSLWTNPQTGVMEAIPRHVEIPDAAGAKDLCRAKRAQTIIADRGVASQRFENLS
jgi:mRNA interferase HicA